DSRNGSNLRALTALLESWVNDSRDKALPRGSAVATPSKRRAALAISKPTARNGGGVLRCSQQLLRPLRRPQASSNTYPNGLTPRQQRTALSRLCTTFNEGKSSMRRKRIKRHNGKPAKDAAPVLDSRFEKLAAV